MDCSCGVTSTSHPLSHKVGLFRGLWSKIRSNGENRSSLIMENRGRSRRLVRDLLVIGAAAGFVLIAIFGRGLRPHTAAMLVGKKFPEIKAEGWLNGKAPNIESMKGKVLVIEAWATRCGPCRALAPEMVKLQKKYQDKDVVFIGMTDENGPLVPTIQSYLKTTGIGWLNAYGAYDTIVKLGADYLPYIWVVDSTGMVAWTSESNGAVEDGIKLAISHREKLAATAKK